MEKRVKQRGECVKYALDISFVFELLNEQIRPSALLSGRTLLFVAIEAILCFAGRAAGVSLHVTEFKRKERNDRKEDVRSKSAARVNAEGDGRCVTGGMGDRLRLRSSTMYWMAALFLDSVVRGGGSGTGQPRGIEAGCEGGDAIQRYETDDFFRSALCV
jgi:hypothetical protein